MLRLKGTILLFCILLILFVLFAIPTAKAVATTGNIIINEITYNPSGSDEGHEWIEVYNNDTVEIEVENWKFYENGINHGLTKIWGVTTLQPGGFAIIADNTSQFQSDYPSFSGNLYDSSFSLSNTGEALALKDKNGNIMNSVTYSNSWGADGNGKSLQLVLATGSWCEGPPTPGATNDCQYCGDGTCDVDESCTNCSADCLSVGQVCCDGTAYVGNCCVDANCTSPQTCVNYNCTTIHYCGDGSCDANETCANCAADCLGAGKVCCDSIAYTGNCCVNANCTSPQTCVNHNCTAPAHYCGDGTCDANETCSCSDCEGKQNGCTSGQLCCSSSCTDLCFSDSGCPSEKTCLNPGTCNASCVNASTIVCDLTLSILAEDVFNVSITQNYYLHVNDTKSNYTGQALITYWIEDSKSAYIRYHTPYNATVDINKNKSRDYTPLKICGNETYYIRAEIIDSKCNDINLANNAATKLITLWGLDPNSIECFKNMTYSLEIPAEVKAEERFAIKIEISNNLNVSQSIEIWSYIYRGAKCYSCYGNETRESNKQIINISAKSSAIVELQNKVNATNGTYYIKVKILKEGFSTPEELTYTIDIKEKEKIEINETAEITTNKTENVTGEIIYKSKSEKVKKIAMYLLSSLLLAIAVYFAIAKRKQIGEFFITKKQEFEKRRRWKEYIQKRRPGVIKRLSKGFLKPGEKV